MLKALVQRFRKVKFGQMGCPKKGEDVGFCEERPALHYRTVKSLKCSIDIQARLVEVYIVRPLSTVGRAISRQA